MAINLDQLETEVYSTPVSKQAKKTEVAKEEWWNKDIQLFGAGMGLQQKEILYTQLAVLLQAGLDIQRSLEMVGNNFKKTRYKNILAEISTHIIDGASFSEALEKTGKFSTYEVYSIQIGEESGELITVLEELGSYYTKSIKYRQMLVGAMAYPAFVISFALLVTFFLLKYLVPMFSDIYKRFDGELPWITQKIIYLSDALGTYGGYFFAGFVIVLGLLYWQRKQELLRRLGAQCLLRIPVFGGIIRHIYLSRLCQSMYLLLHARVPLLKAVELVKKMVGFYPIEESLAKAEKEILEGQALNEVLGQFSFYPEQLIALVQVGEESSTLDQMFRKLAKQYNNEAERKTAMIGSLLEPVLIVSLGILVGVILVAMYMPLFQMTVGVGK